MRFQLAVQRRKNVLQSLLESPRRYNHFFRLTNK